MVSKVLIIAVMLLILYTLGSGLYYLVTDKAKSEGLVRSLTWRISLSLLLFFFLLIGYAAGFLHPHGL